MSRKSKGIDAERDLIHKFWALENWAAIRVAGSGSMRYPSADILAANKIRRLAIECKTSKGDKRYLSEEEVEQLVNFSSVFGAEAWIALKFSKTDWLFMSLDDLKKAGKNFVVDVDLAKKKGLILDELISK